MEFECIKNLERIGAGSQGVVYKGDLGDETIAVKRVGKREAEAIFGLLHLEHQNLIQFLLVSTNIIFINLRNCNFFVCVKESTISKLFLLHLYLSR